MYCLNIDFSSGLVDIETKILITKNREEALHGGCEEISLLVR
jgi:hypothetical protein